MKRHCLHATHIKTLEPSGESFGSTQKLCCDCGKIFDISFMYKHTHEPGHGPYHIIREMVYDNWPEEDCTNASER